MKHKKYIILAISLVAVLSGAAFCTPQAGQTVFERSMGSIVNEAAQSRASKMVDLERISSNPGMSKYSYSAVINAAASTGMHMDCDAEDNKHHTYVVDRVEKRLFGRARYYVRTVANELESQDHQFILSTGWSITGKPMITDMRVTVLEASPVPPPARKPNADYIPLVIEQTGGLPNIFNSADEQMSCVSTTTTVECANKKGDSFSCNAELCEVTTTQERTRRPFIAAYTWQGTGIHAGVTCQSGTYIVCDTARDNITITPEYVERIADINLQE